MSSSAKSMLGLEQGNQFAQLCLHGGESCRETDHLGLLRQATRA